MNTVLKIDPSTQDKHGHTDTLAMQLIQQVKNKILNNDRKISVILDIGCGAGNLTELLDRELSPDRIIGIDIDPQMIAYARDNNKCEHCTYYIQDVSADWDDWHPQLRALEGQVSLVFSNYTLHWIDEVDKCVTNITRLLHSSGILAVDLLYSGDILRHLTDKQRLDFEQWLRYPSEHEFVGRWLTALKNTGRKTFNVDFSEHFVIGSQTLFNEFKKKWRLLWYERYLTKDYQQSDKMDNLLCELVFKETCNVIFVDSQCHIEFIDRLWTVIAE